MKTTAIRLIALLGVVIGLALAGSVQTARADSCNWNGEWPNCATYCAISGNACDAESDGGVDAEWICLVFGLCPDSGGGSGEDVFASFYDEGNGTDVNAISEVYDEGVDYGRTDSAEGSPCRTVGMDTYGKMLVTQQTNMRIAIRVRYCWNGDQLTYTHMYDPILVTCCAPLWRFDGWDDSSEWGGGWSHTFRISGKFQACIQWCYMEKHPWVSITVNRDGSWSWERGV